MKLSIIFLSASRYINTRFKNHNPINIADRRERKKTVLVARKSRYVRPNHLTEMNASSRTKVKTSQGIYIKDHSMTANRDERSTK